MFCPELMHQDEIFLLKPSCSGLEIPIFISFFSIFLNFSCVFPNFCRCSVNFPTSSVNLSSFSLQEAFSVAFHPSGFHLIVGFADKVRLMNLLMEDFRTYKEIPIKAGGLYPGLFRHGCTMDTSMDPIPWIPYHGLS